MGYKIGDKIIFNKEYKKKEDYATTKEAAGWIEPWLIGKVE